MGARGRADRPGPLQRSIGDRAAAAHARRTSAPTRRSWSERLARGDRLPRVARDRRDRVPPRPRRGRSAAVAHRRSLRRLPGRAGAVAGHRSAAAGDHRVSSSSCCSRPASSPATIRASACSKGSSSGSRSCTATCPRRLRSAKGGSRYQVDPYHGQKTGLFLDQRENREAAARYAHGRLLDTFSYNGGFALALAPRCDRGPRGRHLGRCGRADPRERRAATAWRTSRRAR